MRNRTGFYGDPEVLVRDTLCLLEMCVRVRACTYKDNAFWVCMGVCVVFMAC